MPLTTKQDVSSSSSESGRGLWRQQEDNNGNGVGRQQLPSLLAPLHGNHHAGGSQESNNSRGGRRPAPSSGPSSQTIASPLSIADDGDHDAFLYRILTRATEIVNRVSDDICRTEFDGTGENGGDQEEQGDCSWESSRRSQ